MIGNIFSGRRLARWFAIAALSWGVAIDVLHAEGYLPRLGPAALLFQAPRSAFVAVLPPLLMNDKPLPPVVSTNTAPTNAMPARLVASTPSPATNAPVIVVEEVPSTAGLPAPIEAPRIRPPDNITSQMLIRYFDIRGGRTNQHGGLLVPFLFTPPQPPGPTPSSSATYIKE